MTEEQRQYRLAWCTDNRYNTFENYLFVDETKVKLNLNPLYVHRKKATCPPGAGFRLRNQGSMGGISMKGATQLEVSPKKIFLKCGKLWIISI